MWRQRQPQKQRQLSWKNHRSRRSPTHTLIRAAHPHSHSNTHARVRTRCWNQSVRARHESRPYKTSNKLVRTKIEKSFLKPHFFGSKLKRSSGVMYFSSSKQQMKGLDRWLIESEISLRSPESSKPDHNLLLETETNEESWNWKDAAFALDLYNRHRSWKTLTNWHQKNFLLGKKKISKDDLGPVEYRFAEIKSLKIHG